MPVSIDEMTAKFDVRDGAALSPRVRSEIKSVLSAHDGLSLDLNIDDSTAAGCSFRIRLSAFDPRTGQGRWAISDGTFINVLAWSAAGRFGRVNGALYFYSEGPVKIAPDLADFVLDGAAAFGTEGGHPAHGDGTITNPRNTPWAGTPISWSRCAG